MIHVQVVARGEEEEKTLDELMERGKQNGVKNLKIVKVNNAFFGFFFTLCIGRRIEKNGTFFG